MDELIDFILNKDFGKEFAELAKYFVPGKSRTIFELNNISGIKYRDLRDMLIILSKHNIVEIEETIEGTQSIGNYKMNFSEVIHRVRHPRFLDIIQNKYSYLSSLVVEVFFMEGRLTFQGSIEHLKVYFKDEIEEFSEDQIKQEFLNLLDNSFLSRVTMVECKLEEIVEKKTELNSKTNLKKRQQITKTTNLNKKKVISNEASKLLFPQENSIGINQILVVDTKKLSDVTKDPLTQEEYFFRCNCKRFVHELRIENVCNMIRQRLDSTAAFQIAYVLLAHNPILGRGVEVKKSESMTIQEIIEKIPELQSAEIKNMEKIFIQMQSDTVPMLVKENQAFGKEFKYYLNLESISYLLMIKQVEKILSKKFDHNHLRIFRTLQKLDCCDEKQLQEICLLGNKEVRICLDNLIHEGVIERLDIVSLKNLSAFKLRISSFVLTFISKLYKILMNLLIKLKEEEAQVVLLNKDIEINEEKLKELEMKIFKIYSAIIDADDLLAIFTEF